MAIAPTATIASIAGWRVHGAVVSNLFRRETLSAIKVNRYLGGGARLGQWTPEIRDAIKLADGSR